MNLHELRCRTSDPTQTDTTMWMCIIKTHVYIYILNQRYLMRISPGSSLFPPSLLLLYPPTKRTYASHIGGVVRGLSGLLGTDRTKVSNFVEWFLWCLAALHFDWGQENRVTCPNYDAINSWYRRLPKLSCFVLFLYYSSSFYYLTFL